MLLNSKANPFLKHTSQSLKRPTLHINDRNCIRCCCCCCYKNTLLHRSLRIVRPRSIFVYNFASLPPHPPHTHTSPSLQLASARAPFICIFAIFNSFSCLMQKSNIHREAEAVAGKSERDAFSCVCTCIRHPIVYLIALSGKLKKLFSASEKRTERQRRGRAQGRQKVCF
jgi:hypothetical protein